MTASQNLFPSDPDWPDTFNLFRKDVFLNLNCHAIGVIQSFDSNAQTAQVSIVYTKTFFEKDAAGAYVPVQKDYPLIVDAPVIFPGGGGWTLTWPVAKGDECLVLFNDRDIDNWYQGNQGAATATLRLHSFSDAMVLVGVRSKPNAVTSFNATAPEIRNKAGTVKLTLTADGKFSVTNASGEFVAALIQFFQTATAGGYPIVGDLTTLQSFKA